MHNSTKRLFAKIAMITLLFEILFQAGSTLLISCGANIYRNEDVSMMTAGILSVTIVLLLLGVQDVNFQYKKFGPLKFLWILLLVYGIEGLSNIAIEPLINWLADLGHPLDSTIKAASETDLRNIWAIIYSTIAAPCIEECLYRGILYSHFRKYGRIFAITITSILFALMHLNIIQLLPALFIGIVLAWTRDTYGIQYSIMIHMSTNLLAIIFNELGSEISFINGLFIMFIFGGIITLLVTLIINFKKIIDSFRQETTLGSMYITWFTSIPALIITAFYIFIIVSDIILM